nr:hypothetical protein [Sandarakinorhabdus sp.]
MRDADEQFSEQEIKLFGEFLQSFPIGLGRFDLKHLHPALEPAYECLFLVFTEVVAGARMKRTQDRGKLGRGLQMDPVFVLAPSDAGQVALVRDDPRGHIPYRQHVVDQAGVRRAFRHSGHGVAVKFGLREREAAVFLDSGQAERAIAASARKDDANRALALIFGQRLEKGVDRPAAIARRRGMDDPETTAADGHGGIGRDDEHAVRLDRHAVCRLDHVHGGEFADQLCQHAFVIGREMLDKHESHAGIGWQGSEKAFERLEAARRSAYPDSQKHGRFLGLSHFRLRLPNDLARTINLNSGQSRRFSIRSYAARNQQRNRSHAERSTMTTSSESHRAWQRFLSLTASAPILKEW